MTTTDSRQDTATDARPAGSGCEPSLDATFDALAARQCRILLRHLAESDDDAHTIPDLADRLADEASSGEEASDGDASERCDDASGTAGDETDALRLHARLHHSVLPRLADAGLIDYDADRGVVGHRPDSRFASMAPTIASFESADHPVPLDDLLDLLAAFRRRRALLTLFDHGDLSLPDLADEVAVAEHGDPLSRIDAQQVLRVYLSLYHTHVPKLADAGLVEYDQSDDYVALTDAGRAVESPVRSLCDPEN